ncbi:ras-like protein [Collybia nuda]|uniref:Ras-like protein n=1 Tax=Collybia nuda TaxID=64659 RepID=A0A9P5XZK0_9AGAR|nr:ras-like protein [Collybia nuda]
MNKKELKQYKISLVGEGGVGKTAIVNRFTYNQFAMEYDPTLEDSYRKQCMIDEEVVMIELVDPTSQEDYRVSNYWARFVRDGNGVILVYSVTSRFSFDEIRKLRQEVLQIAKQDPFPIILMANKADFGYERQVSLAGELSWAVAVSPEMIFIPEGEALAKEFGCYLFEASAKTGKNIDEAFYELVREIKKSRKEPLSLADAKHNSAQEDNGCCNGCVML